MFRVALTILALTLASVSTAQTRVPQNNTEISLGFAPLVKATAPAVVNIYAKRVVEVRSSPFKGDPFFQNLFRNFGETRPQVQNSLGSGVVLTDDGIIVTNYHVVGMATDIRVVLNDRREYSARVLLGDQESDLAILQLDGVADMPFLHLRDSDTVEVGELVLAIGNPFGVGQTVSSGIVSGLARSGTATGNARGYFLQTDAPINPGNSGGALVDVNGDLIGVNTSILTRSGGSNGIGFAIPSALVAQFVAQAQAGNIKFRRPWAGMSGQSVDIDIANSLELAVPGGIMVSGLHARSPFRLAGFQPGDVILEVDGLPVNNPEEMVYRMSVAGLGAKTEVTALMSGEVTRVTVGLMAAPEHPARDTLTTAPTSVIPGLVLSRVNPAVLNQYGLPLASEGVIVENPGEIGAQAGIRVGDVILGVDDQLTPTPGDVVAAFDKAQRTISLVVQRGTQRLVMQFRI